MSDNSHIMAVTAAELVGLNEFDWMESPGLSWCGDTFETGYVFREQLDTVIGPLLTQPLRSVINGETQTITHPTIELLQSNRDGAVITPLSQAEYIEFRHVVQSALATADWSPHDTYEWDVFVASEVEGDYYVIVEFE